MGQHQPWRCLRQLPRAGSNEIFHLFQRKPSPSAAERENTTRKFSSQVFLPQNECVFSLMVKQILFSFFLCFFFFNCSDLFLVTRGWCSRVSAAGEISCGLGCSGRWAGSQAKPVLALRWVCRCCRDRGVLQWWGGTLTMAGGLQLSPRAPCDSKKSNAFGSFFGYFNGGAGSVALPRCVMRKKGFPPPPFSSTPIVLGGGRGESGCGCPRGGCPARCPCALHGPGWAGQQRQQAGAGAVHEGGCRLSRSGSGERCARPWQPGTVPRLNKPPHLLFFPLKKTRHDPRGTFWAGEESSTAEGCSSGAGSTGRPAVMQPHGRGCLRKP